MAQLVEFTLLAMSRLQADIVFLIGPIDTNESDEFGFR